MPPPGEKPKLLEIRRAQEQKTSPKGAVFCRKSGTLYPEGKKKIMGETTCRDIEKKKKTVCEKDVQIPGREGYNEGVNIFHPSW